MDITDKVKAGEVIIGENCIIGENVEINVKGTFDIGDCSVIGDGCKINCHDFKAGSYLFMGNNVEIGRGGCNNPDSKVIIGDHVGIFENALINPNSPVTIGNDVGIGDGVMIWTHGAWLDITKGFPADFGPVTIGNNVWLPARTTVLPNVTIGNDVVIGIGSIVNKDIPSGSMAAGTPCKIIRENFYPKELDTFELEKLINPILDYWYKVLIPNKGIETVDFLKYNVSTEKIELTQGDHMTYYDVRNKTIEGHNNVVTEDLRDFLRRRGIKIYNGKLFKSIPIK
jgi:acetyltransferase-like isoleucine patch superfamily enzyme